MTQVKLNYQLKDVSDALAPHVERIFESRLPFVAVVEFKPSQRVEELDEGKEDSVRCRAINMEIARGSQENNLREAMRALWVQRSAQGTLDEDSDELELSQQTLDNLGGLVAGEEVARLRVVLQQMLEQADAIAGDVELRADDVRLKLGKVTAQTRRVLSGIETAGV